MPINKSANERYHIIDHCLVNKKYPDVKTLVKAIENYLDNDISVSTVNKDIKQMKKSYGAPIKFDKYHNGYYYSEENFSIKNSTLTYEELNTLEFTISLLQRLKGSVMYNQYEKAVNKLIVGNRITAVLGKTETDVIQIEESLNTESNKWIEVILKAIIEKNCLTVTYHAFGRPEKKHEFSASLLKEYRNRWYTIGYIKNSKSTMVLALDRIVNIEQCSSKYFTDDSFVPAEYFKYSIGITQIHDVKPEKVILSFSPNQKPYLESQPLHHSQKIILDNNKEYRIELIVYLSYELRMMILSFGDNVKVIAPKIFKSEIKETIIEMMKTYN